MKNLQDMTDEEFQTHLESLPYDKSTLERIPGLMAEIQRRSGSGLTRDSYKQIAIAFAESRVPPKRRA